MGSMGGYMKGLVSSMLLLLKLFFEDNLADELFGCVGIPTDRARSTSATSAKDTSDG